MLKSIATLVAFAIVIAVPASATVNVTNDTDPDVTITLTIGCFTNIWWNNTDVDHQINFNDIVGTGGDWFSPTLTGPYLEAEKSSQDPFAEGFYESYDHAFFWIEANCDVTMTIITGGYLSDNGGDELDTWFTMALTNNWQCTAPDCGFINNGQRVDTGNIVPFDGEGSYADGSVVPMNLFTGAFYPNQWSFPMGPGTQTYTANFQAYTEGTILFHARVLRSGISDPAGTYTTSLDFTYSEATP